MTSVSDKIDAYYSRLVRQGIPLGGSDAIYFMELDTLIRTELLCAMDYYALMALTSTCRLLHSLRFQHHIWRRIIAADFGYYKAVLDCSTCASFKASFCSSEPAACEHSVREVMCTFSYYQHLLASRFSMAIRCTKRISPVSCTPAFFVYGGFVRDLFANPLTFHDIDVWASSGADPSVIRGMMPDEWRCSSKKSKETSYGHTIHDHKFKTNTFPRVSIHVQVVWCTPLVRACDIDVNGFYISEFLDEKTAVLKPWAIQLIQNPSYTGTGTKIKLIGSLSRCFHYTPRAKSSLREGVEKLRRYEDFRAVFRGALDRIFLPLLPMYGTDITLCGKDAVPFVRQGRDAEAPLLSDSQLARYGRRFAVMKQRGWHMLFENNDPKYGPNLKYVACELGSRLIKEAAATAQSHKRVAVVSEAELDAPPTVKRICVVASEVDDECV